MQMRVLLILILCMISALLHAQTFEEKTVDIGNIGVNITNVGTIGRPNVRNDPEGAPSLEYPINTGIEHLFEAGFWIGAQVDGEVRVSTAAYDAASGYSTGRAGFEFTSLSKITERSSLFESDNYSASAISHQDYVLSITDSNVVVPGTAQPISGHEFPLGAVVKQESYAWNYSFADFFVIVSYEITNSSSKPWDTAYFSMFSDMVVRNVNVTQESGAAFFNKGGAGILDDLTSIYVWQVAGDDVDYTQSYVASSILGVEYRGDFFHPNNAKTFTDKGLKAPQVHYNFWEFNNQSGGEFTSPVSDIEKYYRMRNSLGVERSKLKLASNKLQMISIGPVPRVEPNETVKFVVAFTCAKQLYDEQATDTKDTEVAREELLEHIGWARRTYIGEDANENGVLDEGEDLNANNKLNRYILPEPPLTPKVKFIPSENAVDIYWDDQALSSVDPISKKKDFEGFKLYRTNVGDDLDRNLTNSSKLVAQWDSAGNKVGFNNGFEAIKLAQPIKFEDDSLDIEYHYHYRMEGLLNGWQYMFILTAFDEGDVELELEPLESSLTANAYRVWSGTPAADWEDDNKPTIGVYPNPYKTTAAWDGAGSKSNKIYFYNLPSSATITIYTSAGELVDQFDHQAATYNGGDLRWYNDLGGEAKQRIVPGGEHAWDMLSTAGQSLAQGLYIFSVEDHKTGKVEQGTFAIIR